MLFDNQSFMATYVILCSIWLLFDTLLARKITQKCTTQTTKYLYVVYLLSRVDGFTGVISVSIIILLQWKLSAAEIMFLTIKQQKADNVWLYNSFSSWGMCLFVVQASMRPTRGYCMCVCYKNINKYSAFLRNLKKI